MENASIYRNKLELRHSGAPELQNVILGIIGRKGTGKSTLTREILQRGNREFIFDAAGDHLWVPDQFTELDLAYQYIMDHGLRSDSFIGSYIPQNDEDEKSLISDANEIASAVWEAGNQTIVFEELPMYSAANWAPVKITKLLRLGRHHAVNIVYTGQRAAELPRRATGATDVFVLFQTSEPADLERIEERAGYETAELVRSLGEHEFVVFDAKGRCLVQLDEQWYDRVLTPAYRYTPAIGGRHGKSGRWSLDDGE